MKEEGICLCRARPVPPTSQTGPLMPRAESEPWGSGQAHHVVSSAAQGTQVGEAGVMAPYSPGPGVGRVGTPGPPPSCPPVRASEPDEARCWLPEGTQRGQGVMTTLSSWAVVHRVLPKARWPANQVPRT